MLVAIGKSRKSLEWENKDVSWESLVKRFSRTTYTGETEAEYKAMNKDRRNNIKDIGGIVGGELSGPQRKAENLVNRCVLSLDIDFGTADTWDAYQTVCDWECLMHTTHSHTKDNPRYRMYFPLKRTVTKEEYTPIGRKVAEIIGIELFDDTTFEASRLMYWPSTCKDGEFLVWHQEGPWIDPDEILGMYKCWQDESTWPVSSRVTKAIRKSQGGKQADPRLKSGIVGAFCKVYTIPEAIRVYLPDVYDETDEPDRYTYSNGTTAKGLKIFDDGLFAQSWHESDPAHGRLCNAFDLVRLHRFPNQDETEGYNSMISLLNRDEAVQKALDEIIYRNSQQMFDDGFNEDELDRDEMDLTETGNAIRLKDKYGQYMCYNPSLKWCIWDGVKWMTDAESLAIRHVMRMNDIFKNWAKAQQEKFPEKKDEEGNPLKEQDPGRIKAGKALAWAIKSREWNKISNTLKAARGVMKDELVESFDRNPWELNTPLGIIDLKTGELLPHNPANRCTYITSVSPDWDMLHDDWDRFLDLITCGNTELQDYLQQIAGMALVGEVYEESLIMCYGSGSNGKSTLFQIWMQIMGTYADSVRNEVIMGNRWGGEVTGADQLRGKRLVITSELEESQVMSSAMMKKLTSRDVINANVKYAKAISFRPTHTLVLHTNHLPRLRSVDHGTVRRIAVIPFKAQIAENEKRTDFAEELIRNEGPAILAWMINGAVWFYNNHMTIQKPTIVVEESRRYIEGEDIINRFVQDRCERGGRAYVSSLYHAFKAWCEDDGTFCKYGRNKFSEELKNRLKLTSGRDGKGTFIEGLTLQDEGEL